MKKFLLFAAAVATSVAANAEVFNYGFQYEENEQFPFISALNNEESEFYKPGNYQLVSKEGYCMPETLGYQVVLPPAEGEEKGSLRLGIGVSMLDGGVYKLNPDVEVPEDFAEDIVDMPQENYEYPIFSWGPKGVTRTLVMPGWGTTDEWVDADYNAATPEDWIPCKNGVQFTRLGTNGVVSRQDTYFQYPAVTGDVTVTVWASTNLGGTANENNELKVRVTPVFNHNVDEEQAVTLQKEEPANKRYYKLGPVKFDANGKNLEVRVGCDGALLNLMYVRIEGEKGVNAVEGIQAAAEDGVAYNMFGVKVSDDYKGLVIKNGKKFIRK